MNVVISSAMPWPTLPLGELCAVNIGRTPARDESRYWGPGLRWLSISDMNQGRDVETTKETITEIAVQECNCRLTLPGTVLLSFKLSIGKVGIARVPLYTNEAIASLPINDPSRLSPGYLYWVLRSINLTVGLDRAAKGLTLNKEKLLQIEIPLPALIKQRRIAEILDKADALRAKRRAVLARLDELTQSIFLELFGDPISNPKRWPTTNLSDVLSIPLRNGLSPSKAGKVSAKVLTLSSITGIAFDANAVKVATFHRSPPDDQSVDAQDFLICRGNGNLSLVGRGQFPDRTMAEVTFPDTMIAARVAPAVVRREFLAKVWNSVSVRRQIDSLARTTNGTHKVNQTALESISFFKPPLELQDQFARAMATIDAVKSKQTASQVHLDGLFGSLQHRAFRGEL